MKSKKRELTQIVVLLIAALIPYFVDFSFYMKKAIKAGVDIEFKEFLILDLGKYAISAALILLILFFVIRKSNRESVFNEAGNEYYNYSYGWYWFCSKILGYQKCSLIRVPISMQYKLLINQVFHEYVFGSESEYTQIDNENITITIKNESRDTVNLVLADTYPIPERLLPGVVSDFKTIMITRENTGDGRRYISNAFCNQVQAKVYQLVQSGCKTINVFPTTNVVHNIRIVRNAFMKGGRGDIKHLYVFDQPNTSDGDWRFSDKGTKIR